MKAFFKWTVYGLFGSCRVTSKRAVEDLDLVSCQRNSFEIRNKWGVFHHIDVSFPDENRLFSVFYEILTE